MGRDRAEHHGAEQRRQISIHSPHMGRDGIGLRQCNGHCSISIHSPRMGRDVYQRFARLKVFAFQSTLPAWGETIMALRATAKHRTIFQSTLPAWGETRPVLSEWIATDNFNPLSPHGERPRGTPSACATAGFQSTLPAWGETVQMLKAIRSRRFQSTLPAWGETCDRGEKLPGASISIHSPRMGRDDNTRAMVYFCPQFQSTLPAWGETGRWALSAGGWRNFNPLSPHGERRPAPQQPREPKDFNPLSPHGERLLCAKTAASTSGFQSTLPAWGETTRIRSESIRQKRFQSTLPAWGETQFLNQCVHHATISIHSPRMGRDAALLHGVSYGY